MAFTEDIELPINSKYISFRSDIPYNSNYDIIWSFKFSISGSEYGISTFLTTVTGVEENRMPGQYMCSTPSNSAVNTLPIMVLSGNSIEEFFPCNLISVAFDTSGLCGLSSQYRPGVGYNSISAMSLVVRDISNNVIFYSPLTALNYTSSLTSCQIVRCIYSNSNKSMQIDYREEYIADFKLLAKIDLDYYIINDDNLDIVYTGVSFCTPISSKTILPGTLHLYNLHHEGVTNNTSVEVLTSDFIS